MMYTFELQVEGVPQFTYSITENAEQCWMAAGVDLLSLREAPAVQAELDVWYANENLKSSPEYYEVIYPDYYDDVLHFFDRVMEACREWPEATVEVRY